MILVTGASGFLGKRLIQALQPGGEMIVALSHSASNIPETRADNVIWIHADVLDVVQLSEAMKGVEKVYHCAARVSFEQRHHEEMMRTNVEGTANVVNAALAAGVRKLLHVSSTAALGRSGKGELITENAAWQTNRHNSVYARSKFLAEQEVWRGIVEGLPAVIVNPCTIIGPGNWFQGTPRLFHACRNGMPFYPGGMNAFVALDDVVKCMIRLMDSSVTGERFIIAAENMTYKDLLTLITRSLGKQEPRFKIPRMLANLTWMVSSVLHKTLGIYPLLTRETARTVNSTYRYSNEKIRQQLNYDFQSPHDFIAQTAHAYKVFRSKIENKS